MLHPLRDRSIGCDEFRQVAGRLADPNMSDKERAELLMRLFTGCEHSPSGVHVPEKGEHQNSCTYCGGIIE